MLVPAVVLLVFLQLATSFAQTSPPGECTDLVDDCAALAYLCNNTGFKDIMRQRCAKTCGYCGSPSTANPECRYDWDCPSGYYCYNWTHQCFPAPPSTPISSMCQYDWQCADGYCCSSHGHCLPCPYTTASPGCQYNWDCPTGYYCYNWTHQCYPSPASARFDSSVCQYDWQCADDYYCASNGQCLPYPHSTVNPGCHNDWDCPTGYYCYNWTHQCYPAPASTPSSSKCQYDWQCADDYYCASNGQCLPYPYSTANPGCQYDWDCPTGYYCYNWTHQCYPAPPSTPSPSKCQYDWQCADDYYCALNGQCLPYPYSTASPVCQDSTPDCASLAYLCDNPSFKDIMRQRCPKTCGFCGDIPDGTTAGPYSMKAKRMPANMPKKMPRPARAHK